MVFPAYIEAVQAEISIFVPAAFEYKYENL